MTISGTLPLMGVSEAKELMNVALGAAKADLAVVNARLMNVYTGELLEKQTVTVKGKWIASVGGDSNGAIGAGTTVIDAGGKTLIPGLIDGHIHLSPLFNVSEFLKYAIKGGTTAMVSETLEYFPMGGYEGVLDFLASYHNQPVKIFATAPSMVSISNACRGISLETLRKLLERDDIIGLGESYWQALIQNPDSLLPLYEETLRSGKTVEGHSAGASGKKLMAYVAAGVSSCHEPIAAGEVLERLRLGINVMIREGSIRRDLEAIATIKDSGAQLRRLTVVSDGIDPEDLLKKGYMEFVVQKAIDCGFDPVTAVQMATINVAEHFSLSGLIGGIAPGRYADMLIIPDERTIRPNYVISNGCIVAKDGEILVPPRQHTFAQRSLNSVHLPSPMTDADFRITASGGTSSVRVRIIDQVTELVTAELLTDVPASGGEIKADSEKDLIKVAAIDRTHNPGKRFVGLIRGFRMRSGAIASSAAWDTSDIIVVGANDADMAAAVNRIRELQGGTVVCEGGKILVEIPMPVLGLISDLPMETLAEKMKEVRTAAARLGVPFANPFLTLITLTGSAIPYLRICEEGLVNLKDGKTVGLFVD